MKGFLAPGRRHSRWTAEIYNSYENSYRFLIYSIVPMLNRIVTGDMTLRDGQKSTQPTSTHDDDVVMLHRKALKCT